MLLAFHHQTNLFKMVQFDFEEVNFESGLGIKLLLSFAIAT